MSPTLLKRLGWPMSIAMILIMLGVALLWLSHQSRDKAIRQRTLAAQQASEQSDRYHHTIQDEAPIRRTIARFDSLRERGIIGPERRLDWADRMHSIQDSLHLGQLDFELSPMRLVAPVSTSGTDYQLAISRMHFNASLLHEGDLFDLFDNVLRQSDAIVAPRSCKLTPIGEDPRQSQRINLRLDCTLDWITVSTKSTPKP